MIRIRKLFFMFLVLIVLVLSFSACGQVQVTLNEDENALYHLIDDYWLQGLEIQQLSRYNINDDMVIYNISWSLEELKEYEDEPPVNHLFINSPGYPRVRRVFFADMEKGLAPDIKPIWENAKDKGPDYVFSQEEINTMLERINTKFEQ